MGGSYGLYACFSWHLKDEPAQQSSKPLRVHSGQFSDPLDKLGIDVLLRPDSFNVLKPVLPGLRCERLHDRGHRLRRFNGAGVCAVSWRAVG